ncbi:hypothetical protein BD324DRAFT_647865 [Kockovaella imperatae]|uniref:Uncharacterized protein n=1 Tax=Kockovaella imperatae TaxID=4999 RepID=A0A1Y1USM6_9TREE|nr:hypothetical protein BD324DRAFT_647865 [Kockovaella imperatae]ORX40962.1 hypothetical protein BD324DRAFT_647865 [Kockovaella imperatae]
MLAHVLAFALVALFDPVASMPWRGHWQATTSTAVVQEGGVYDQAASTVPVVNPASSAPVDLGQGQIQVQASSVAQGVPLPSVSSGSAGGASGAGDIALVSTGTETHVVNLVNRCGQGTAVFQDVAGKTYTGSKTTYSGELISGLAWIKGAYGCGDKDGANCGDVEFTLKNGGIRVSITRSSRMVSRRIPSE